MARKQKKRNGDTASRRAPARAADEGYDEYEYDEEEAARKAGRGCLIAFLAVLGVVIIGVAIAWFSLSGEINGKNATATGDVAIDVSSGAGGRTIGKALEEAGMIGNADVFRYYVRFAGSGSGFVAGRHHLTPGMTYDEIIDTLSQTPPPRETTRVTFPEGSTIQQFASIMEKANLCTAAEFVAAANDLDAYRDDDGTYPDDIGFLNHLDFDPDTYMIGEGYLAPNTYDFYTDDTAYNMVRKLLVQFNTELESLPSRMERDDVTVYELLDERNLTLRELVTMGSLVEEEAGVPGEDGNPSEDQLRVSGVFWNRFRGDLSQSDVSRRTMGSDATFFYIRDWIARDYGGSYENVPDNLFYAYYTADDDPQVRDGLMAGPISCPGIVALQAALEPAESNDFYFLTDFYGNYYYAQYYSQHEGNIATMNRMNAQWEREQAASENAA